MDTRLNDIHQITNISSKFPRLIKAIFYIARARFQKGSWSNWKATLFSHRRRRRLRAAIQSRAKQNWLFENYIIYFALIELETIQNDGDEGLDYDGPKCRKGTRRQGPPKPNYPIKSFAWPTSTTTTTFSSVSILSGLHSCFQGSSSPPPLQSNNNCLTQIPVSGANDPDSRSTNTAREQIGSHMLPRSVGETKKSTNFSVNIIISYHPRPKSTNLNQDPRIAVWAFEILGAHFCCVGLASDNYHFDLTAHGGA